jgi:hypothetical protein
MKKIFGFLFLFTLCLTSMEVNAQDIMIMRNKPDSIKIKVLEIGVSEIKYRSWPLDESMPVMVESKDRIKRIIFQNGTVLKFSENEFVDATNYVDQRKMIVKIDMLSTMFGTTSLAFEKNIEPGRSWEAGLGIIGAGFNKEEFGKRTGVFVRTGYKFIQTPDYYMRGMRYAHIMKGSYVRPELVFTSFNATESNIDYSLSGTWPNYIYTITQTDTRTKYSAISLMLNFGKQWVFSDVFAVDIFTGIGIGGGNTVKLSETTSTSTSNTYPSYSYSNSSENDSPLGLGMVVNYNGMITVSGQVGMKLGYLIGTKKSKK